MKSWVDRARVPCCPVNNIADMVNDPQVAAREMLVDFDIPGMGKVPLNGVVIKMSETPGAIDMPGPGPGEQNQEVHSTILGFTPEQLAQLKAEGVVWQSGELIRVTAASAVP